MGTLGEAFATIVWGVPKGMVEGEYKCRVEPNSCLHIFADGEWRPLLKCVDKSWELGMPSVSQKETTNGQPIESENMNMQLVGEGMIDYGTEIEEFKCPNCGGKAKRFWDVMEDENGNECRYDDGCFCTECDARIE